MARLYFEHALRDLAVLVIAGLFGGHMLARMLWRRNLRWTWALAAIPVGWLLFVLFHATLLAAGVWLGCLDAAALGARWHREDLHHGADIAEAVRNRVGLRGLIRSRLHQHKIKRNGWLSAGRLTVGVDVRGLPVTIPVGRESGSHTLVVGATGSGKTVSEAWVACRLIDAGHAAIVIDPKGDELLHDELALAAQETSFYEWTPEGPWAYNPYAAGTPGEIADKALSGEQFTEPHYLRQAQRYLGHAVRAMHTAGIPVSPVSLMSQLDPRQLEVTARDLPQELAAETQAYLDGLTERQRRELAGVRDRLSILAESDTRHWLHPTPDSGLLDIHQAVQERAVVYFRLDSDRRPLLAAMLAAAIVSDLISLVARLQADPVATVVVIDEFSAVAAEHVARLFARARSAGVSLILGTQELADLKSVGDGALREQTLGNVATVIAHRQNVPESAELIAAVAGTRPVWVTTQQTEQGFFNTGPSDRGTRRRGYEFEIHPSRIKQLTTGQAAVITPGTSPPAIAWMHHPYHAHPAAPRRRLRDRLPVARLRSVRRPSSRLRPHQHIH